MVTATPSPPPTSAPDFLPNNGGVELTRVEEDAVEGRGQATLPEDGQGSPKHPQVCGDEDRTSGTHFGVTGWSWVGLTVGDGERRPPPNTRIWGKSPVKS